MMSIKSLKCGTSMAVIGMMAAVAMALTGANSALADGASPLGPDAQLFGLLAANGSLTLAHSSTVSDVSQAPAPPEVGAASKANIAGPTSYLTGDLIVQDAGVPVISLGAHDTVVGSCATGGPGPASISLGSGASCGSTSTDGTSPLIETFSAAVLQVEDYSAFLGGLTTTNNLGDITLKKYQSLTIKLTQAVNVVSIGKITTAGSNSITLSAPKNAVVVINITGGLSLGAGTQVFNSNGLNPHNLIWNIQSANPTFGSNMTLSGTILNVPSPSAHTTVTFGAGSSLNGAVLSDGDIVGNGALHLNFWPFTATPEDIGPCSVERFRQNNLEC
jgi:choice-of-anchor A domain-containing protein